MIGVPSANDTHTAFFRLVDSQLHRHLTDKLPHSGIALYHCTHGCLKDDLGSGMYIDHALFDSFMVSDHALHAVTLDAVQVGHQQVLRDRFRLRRFKSEVHKSIHQKMMECIIGPFHITHFFPSCSICWDGTDASMRTADIEILFHIINIKHEMFNHVG